MDFLTMLQKETAEDVTESFLTTEHPQSVPTDFMTMLQRETAAQVQESATRGLFANLEQLDEAKTTYSPSTGDLLITIIKPGWSKNNRYYSPELLKSRASIFEGCKMFVDHSTDAEDKQRPEGSVRDWVGTIKDVKAEADGTLKAMVNVHDEGFKRTLSNLQKAGNLPQMGVSIRAYGEASPGDAGGRKGLIVNSLLGCKSVDFVTFAGAGGQVESMLEAFDPNDPDLKRLEEENDINNRKKKLVESWQAAGYSEDEARGIMGLPSKLMESLTRIQQAEYSFAVRSGMSEADALKFVKI